MQFGKQFMVRAVLATFGIMALAAVSTQGLAATPASSANVITYHYDNLRTGWNPNETLLTPAVVQSSQFKSIATAALDDQVDAQPLFMANQKIKGQGTHDVLYVATESNTIYALDAATGAILLQRNLGKPVPQSALPGQCNNNGPNIGVTGTPVIDPAAGILYAIAYSYERKQQTYRLHALNLSTLSDKTMPAVITASGQLSDGSTYTFNPAVSRQRAALLLANGTVYAGFASFCDEAADQSRGWVLGWNASTLAPLPANHLDNALAQSPDNFFLTSIWMSGYGLAASAAGDIYFVTGNSDFSGTTYDKHLNLTESVIQISADLRKVRSAWTPKGKELGWQVLDQYDLDFGSGGAMLLPPQNGQPSSLLVAAGKVGVLYLLNADDLTNGQKGNKSILDHHNMGECWCGPSYFTGADGIGRVVTSGGQSGAIWKVDTANGPHLEGEFALPAMVTGQDPGFFTSVSSNGTQANTQIVWAVSRPTSDQDTSVSLYAFDAGNGTELFSGISGDWPNTGGNSNIVPVVANGRVYVASNKTVSIFGLTGGAAAKPMLGGRKTPEPLAAGQHEFYGLVTRIAQYSMSVLKRDGTMVTVDIGAAERAHRVAPPAIGHGVMVRGTMGQGGVVTAQVVGHAKPQRALWPADR